ncbi:unnamed protein product [Arctia plantaginis]|uniref:Uncharacterized protein n=1 Tax=Arctia plantaginis TaxID=874455 RepID=A0A8S1BNQ7_ARCPL|nr:unnamed protein product [Arctia plantaginis]
MSLVHTVLVLFAVILIVQIAESHFIGGFGYPGFYPGYHRYPRFGFGGGFGGGFGAYGGYYGGGFYGPRPLPPPIIWG